MKALSLSGSALEAIAWFIIDLPVLSDNAGRKSCTLSSWAFFIEAFPREDLNFKSFTWGSITRGSHAEAFTSKPAAWLGPRGVTLSSCNAALSEFAPGACSALPDHAFVTAVVSKGEDLNWCGVVKVGSDMVVALSFDAFAHDELLAGHLAGCAVLGLVALVSIEESVNP